MKILALAISCPENDLVTSLLFTSVDVTNEDMRMIQINQWAECTFAD